MADACEAKQKAATDAIAAANDKISRVEASQEALYARAMATMTAKERAALVASEPSAALKAKAQKMAQKMDEEDEKRKDGATYPVKEKPKVSAESPAEAALRREVAELRVAPLVAQMRDFRASLGMDTAEFDALVDALDPDQVAASYSLEAPIYAALSTMSVPPPAATIPGFPAAPPQFGQYQPAPQPAPQALQSPQAPYGASAEGGEFRL